MVPLGMLLFERQFRHTTEMIDDRDTQHQVDDQQTAANAGPDGVSLAFEPPDEPIPPPPSAPGEFLASQWIGSLTPVVSYGRVGEPLAPPPPSAPGEFLTAQWSDGVIPELQDDEGNLAIFRDAVPDCIVSSSQLEALAADSVLSDETLPPSDDEVRDDIEEAVTVRLREVPLAPDEDISLVFLPGEGLVDEVPRSGQALILTNQRLIAFRGVEGFRDTHMALASEITQCSVRTGQRNWGAILQGLMIMIGGAFLYLIVGYWLAGQVSGPNVPVLNIDVAPLIALLIILAGLFILASNYFTRPAGAIIFHGLGVEIAFPFRSSLGLGEIYEFVDRVQSVRWRGNPVTPDNDPPDASLDSEGGEQPPT